jgi:quercetin dioxygenase-like cupin family protein
MSHSVSQATAFKTPRTDQSAISLMGPIAQWLASAEQASDQFCVLDATQAPGVFVPLHSHPEVECIYVVEGALQVLSYHDGEPYWLDVDVGESVVIPGHARHAIRNIEAVTARLIMMSAASMGHFFEEIGRPVVAGEQPPMPTPEWAQAFVKSAVQHGYWLASPEENAAIGLTV